VEPTRLVHTSCGPIEVEVQEVIGRGLGVAVKVYGENGWAHAEKLWSSKDGHHSKGESLASFLSVFVGIPEEEADRLATAISTEWMEDWRARGGEAESRLLNRRGIILMASVVGLILLALLGIALLVLLLV
jgi:hypothetical protein